MKVKEYLDWNGAYYISFDLILRRYLPLLKKLVRDAIAMVGCLLNQLSVTNPLQ